MNEKDLREKTNPVYETAKDMLLDLALIGNEQAGQAASALGINAAEILQDPEKAKSLNPANQVFVEARYESMNDLINQSEAKTIVDLPCGYNPRFLQTPADKLYIGADLPAVIEEAGPLFESLKEGRSIEYHEVDALNYASLKKALENAQGPLVFSVDGLLSYFSDGELKEFFHNIKALLQTYGGEVYTADPLSPVHLIGTMGAVYGKLDWKKIHQTGRNLSEKANIRAGNNTLTISPKREHSHEKALAFMDENGFKVEEISLGAHVPELKSYEKLTPEQIERVKAFYDTAKIWKLTLKEDAAGLEPESIAENENSVFAFKLDGNNLSGVISGRVDSLNAPELLSAYEQVSQKFDGRIDLDFTDLEYISSAGFRVLLIMVREDHPVHIHNASEEVKELFRQMGFDQILSLE